MSDTSHRQFFGDAEYSFKLTPPMILELERKTGAGIGGLCRRLFNGEFKHNEIIETIRLALIGGGTAPATAASLVAAYVGNRPLSESYPIAVSVLEVLWFGRKREAANGSA